MRQPRCDAPEGRASLRVAWGVGVWAARATAALPFRQSLSPHSPQSKFRNAELIDNVPQHFCLSYSKYCFQKFLHFNMYIFFYFFIILKFPTYYLLLLFIVKCCFKIEKISFPSFRHPHLQI